MSHVPATFTPVVNTIDLTPSADGYAAIGAMLINTVIGDVKRGRQDAAVYLLTTVIDIAFEIGRAAQEQDVVHADGAKLRDALFARVGGPKR